MNSIPSDLCRGGDWPISATELMDGLRLLIPIDRPIVMSRKDVPNREERLMNQLLAYFDPSAGSLLLQALVGGFGGIAVAGRYFWLQLRGNKATGSKQ
jgi:hypothetical protein